MSRFGLVVRRGDPGSESLFGLVVSHSAGKRTDLGSVWPSGKALCW